MKLSPYPHQQEALDVIFDYYQSEDAGHSLACACHLEKFDFLAIEKDEDYHKASVERLETLKSQGVLF